MKIVYIIKSFALKAGVERVVSDKMNYLAEHGCDMVMVTYEQGAHPPAFPLHKSIRHYMLDARFFRLGQLPLWQRPAQRRQMRRRLREGLQRIVDDERPDIVVATTYSMKVLDIILALRTPARRILESHIACHTVRKTCDHRRNPLLLPMAWLYDRRAFARIARFDRLVVLTQGDAADWSRYTDRVAIIPNPVTRYPDTVPVRDGSGRRIISVGRLHEQKGYDMLVEAFARIAHRCPEWHIDIFGTGDDQPMLQQRIATHGLQGRINIVPPTSSIYDEYMASEFYVLSSRYEGYPLVLGEAMSCGLPCVAFRCKYGPEEAIADGENGLLVADGDVDGLAQAMLWMAEHPAERLQMGAKARQAARRLAKDIIMKQWEDLFRSLAGTPKQ